MIFWFFFSLVGLYKLFKYGLHDKWTLIVGFSYVIGCVILGGIFMGVAKDIDWQAEIGLGFDIPSKQNNVEDFYGF
jgi:hypothetical protein